MKNRPTMWILIALDTGNSAGYVCHSALAEPVVS
jgi:hypothetical protein